MAGTPEQLGATAKTNLAEYYFGKLIKDAPGRKFRPWRDNVGSFEHAEVAIGLSTGKRIHPVLVETLGLDKLLWQIAGENEMSGLLIGGNFNPEERVSTNEALATIETTRRMKLIDGRYYEPVPLFLRIAGVAKNNRIVAATYDPTEGNRLTRLNVSLPPEEALSINNDDYLNSLFLNKLWIAIPTDKNMPYHTAGLITQSMCDKAGTTSQSLPQYVNKVLAFQLREHVVMLGKAKNPQDTQNLNYAFNKMGYYVYKENGFIRVRLATADVRRKNIEPWEVSIPAAL